MLVSICLEALEPATQAARHRKLDTHAQLAQNAGRRYATWGKSDRRILAMGTMFNSGIWGYQAIMPGLIVLIVIIGAVVKFFSSKKDSAHLHGRVDYCPLIDGPGGPFRVSNSRYPQRTDAVTMPKARGSARGHAARNDSAMKIPRAWVTVAGIVSCMLMLQGCGALQGCLIERPFAG